MNHPLPSASELLQRLTTHPDETITVAEIIRRFQEGGFSLLLLLFAAPLALPLPALGVAQVMALPILCLSAQLMMGRRSPWLPQRLGRKTITMESLRSIVNHAVHWLEKMEWLIKPRLAFLSSKAGHQLTGLVCILCACSIAVPVPFSNTVPSMGIVLMSLGLLERDGLVIIGGMIVGLLGIALAVVAYYLGIEFITGLFE